MSVIFIGDTRIESRILHVRSTHTDSEDSHGKATEREILSTLHWYGNYLCTAQKVAGEYSTPYWIFKDDCRKCPVLRPEA